MADYFVATSVDGVQFRLNSDWTWEPDISLQTPENYIRFRSSNWGDSPAKVQKDESEILTWLNDTTLYANAISVAGSTASCSFRFVDGMLCSGGYGFQEERRDANLRVLQFDQLKAALNDKYGDAEIDGSEVVWLNDRYKRDPSKRVIAIAAGHCTETYRWLDGETYLSLSIDTDSDGVMSRLNYISVRLLPLLTAKRNKAISTGL